MMMTKSHIIDYPKNYNVPLLKSQEIAWGIDKKLLKYLKQAYIGKSVESEIYNKMWRMFIYPNGYTDTHSGECWVGLTCCGLPRGVHRMKVENEVTIIEANVINKYTCDFHVDQYGRQSEIMAFDKMKKYDKLTIKMVITIKSIYDKNDNEIKDLDASIFTTRKHGHIDDKEKKINMVKSVNFHETYPLSIMFLICILIIIS